MLLVLHHSELRAQREEPLKHQLNLNVFRLEFNSDAYPVLFRPKLITGVGYVYQFSNWGWTSALHYADHFMPDHCPGCVDAGSGSARLVEFVVQSGLRYNWGFQRHWRLQPYAALNLFGSYTSYYAEVFGSAWFIGTYTTDVAAQAIGLATRIGVQWRIADRGLVTCASSLRLGMGPYQNHASGHTGISDSFVATLVQLGGGFLF